MTRGVDKKQRPDSQSGTELWNSYWKNRIHNILHLCLYAGANKLGEKEGKRSYYELAKGKCVLGNHIYIQKVILEGICTDL